MITSKKRFVSLGLSVSALIAHAADGYYYYGQYFGFTGENTAALIAPIKSDDQTLKKEYSGEFVIQSVFPYNRVAIKITAIANDALVGSSITSLNTGGMVAQLGKGCAHDVKTLTSVTFGSPIISVGAEAFYNCTSLTELTLSENLEYIGASAFSRTKINGELNLPASVKTIMQNAFLGTNISKVTFNSPHLTIGSYAFYQCNQLKTVNVANVNDWCRYTFEDENSNPLLWNTVLTENDQVISEINLDEDLETIPYGAFYNVQTLTTVTIGSGIKDISARAFYSSSIKDFTCKATTPPNVEDNSFSNLNYSYTTLHVPSSSIDEYSAHPVWGKFKIIEAISDISTSVSRMTTEDERGFYIEGNCIISLQNTHLEIYNLNGQRIECINNSIYLPSGIYLINGKKIRIAL